MNETKKISDSFRHCCVPQCKSTYSKNISLLSFPHDEKSKKKWAQALKIKGKISPFMFVCSLHFLPSDFDKRGHPRRPLIKRSVIPSLKIPNNESEKNSKSKSGRSSSNNTADDSPLRTAITEKKDGAESCRRSKRVPKKKSLKPFLFVDVDEMKIIKPEESPRKLNRRRPNILRTKGSVPIKKPRNSSRVKAVGIQTEPTTDNNIIGKGKRLEKDGLNKIIDFLRDNLLDREYKMMGKIHKINACSISFERCHDKQTGMLEVYPKMIKSSGKMIIDLCSMFESDEDNSETDECTEPDIEHEDLSSPVKKIDPKPMVVDTQKKKTPTKNQPAQKDSKVPIFDKDVKILLSRLPEDLVEVVCGDQPVNVQTENFLQNGVSFRRLKVQAKQKIPEVGTPQFFCQICSNNFSSSSELNNHIKIHAEQEMAKILKKQAEKKSKTEKVVDKKPTNETPSVEESSFSCTLCKKKFKYYHSLEFHKKLMHEEKEKKEQEQSCPECSQIFWTTKELDRHLLNVHKTVLQKSTYKCDACSKLFITYGSLIHHQENTHEIEMDEDFEIKVICATCKKLINIQHYKLEHARKCKEQRKKDYGFYDNNNQFKDDTTTLDPIEKINVLSNEEISSVPNRFTSFKKDTKFKQNSLEIEGSKKINVSSNKELSVPNKFRNSGNDIQFKNNSIEVEPKKTNVTRNKVVSVPNTYSTFKKDIQSSLNSVEMEFTEDSDLSHSDDEVSKPNKCRIIEKNNKSKEKPIQKKFTKEFDVSYSNEELLSETNESRTPEKDKSKDDSIERELAKILHMCSDEESSEPNTFPTFEKDKSEHNSIEMGYTKEIDVFDNEELLEPETFKIYKKDYRSKHNSIEMEQTKKMIVSSNEELLEPEKFKIFKKANQSKQNSIEMEQTKKIIVSSSEELLEPEKFKIFKKDNPCKHNSSEMEQTKKIIVSSGEVLSEPEKFKIFKKDHQTKNDSINMEHTKEIIVSSSEELPGPDKFLIFKKNVHSKDNSIKIEHPKKINVTRNEELSGSNKFRIIHKDSRSEHNSIEIEFASELHSDEELSGTNKNDVEQENILQTTKCGIKRKISSGSEEENVEQQGTTKDIKKRKIIADSREENIEQEYLNQETESEDFTKQSDEPSNEIINKLKAILASSDGSNDVIIENID